MEDVDTFRSHIVGMNSPYPTDSVEFAAIIIIQSLRGAITPIVSGFRIVLYHGAASESSIIADLNKFRVYTERVLNAVNSFYRILRASSAIRTVSLRRALNCYRLTKRGKSALHSLCRRWNRRFSRSKPKAFIIIPRAMNSTSKNLGAMPHQDTFPSSLTQFPVKFLQIPRILTKFAINLRISRAAVLSSLHATNLLIIYGLHNLSFINN